MVKCAEVGKRIVFNLNYFIVQSEPSVLHRPESSRRSDLNQRLDLNSLESGQLTQNYFELLPQRM
jgi:hypothetical protein